jgi:hypothetical protein
MQRNLTKNKKCKNEDCTKRFDQVRFGQVACDTDCAIEYARQQRKKKEKKEINKRAANKTKDHPRTYYKENKAQLQKLVQHIARLIDKGVVCIDCDIVNANPCFDGGHYKSKGSSSSIRYNLHNIFQQARGCNHQGQTSDEKFLRGIEEKYGKEYATYCDGLALQFKYIGLKAPEYPHIITEALKIVRELKKMDLFRKTTPYSPEMRIKLRDQYNDRLGIYK